jgi:hypothetical protein
MSCNFKLPFTGSADEVLNKARTGVQGQGGNFSGDASTGNFDVTAFGNTIKGSYSITGNELAINIDDKPFFLPCITIEGFLKNQLGL